MVSVLYPHRTRTNILSVKLWWPAIWGHIQAKRKGLKPYYWGLGLFTTEDRKDPKVQRLIQADPFRGERFVDHTKVVSTKKCHAWYDDCECVWWVLVCNTDLNTGDYNRHLSNSCYAKVCPFVSESARGSFGSFAIISIFFLKRTSTTLECKHVLKPSLRSSPQGAGWPSPLEATSLRRKSRCLRTTKSILASAALRRNG